MKQIGQTKTGNILLECNKDELRALVALEVSAKGKTFFSGVYIESLRDSLSLDDEFVAYFEAVKEWVSVSERVNEFRKHLDLMDEHLNKTRAAE